MHAFLCTLACSFASAHSHHTANEVIADHSNHKQSIPLSKIASGHIVGDSVFVVNTPGPKELPPTALSALGPNWADDSADGFRLVAGGVGPETQGHSPWEPDGSPQRGQQRFAGTGITTSWTFNTVDGHCHLPHGAVINAIYATWTTRGSSGAKYSYTEGHQSHSANANHEFLPHPDLELYWTDAADVVRTSRFQKIFSGPIEVGGKDGFTLNAQKILGKNSHQTDAIVLDVTLKPSHLTAGEMPVAGEVFAPSMRQMPKKMIPMELPTPLASDMPVVPSDTKPLHVGTDWMEQPSSTMRSKVVADDGLFGPEFIEVEAGSLPPSSWAGAQAVHTFHLAKTEVTWAQFLEVRTWAAANGYDIGSVGAGTGPNRPVTNVNWHQALKWCNAWSEKEGLDPVYKIGGAVYRSGVSVPSVDATANGYRLPSEKEWEFAARGGVQTKGYDYSGSNDFKAVAWYKSNSGGSTQDVATKQANELGIHDMSGNVEEWFYDVYSDQGSWFVGADRGGSWISDASGLGVADRVYVITSRYGSGALGFRVARNSADGLPLTSGGVETDTILLDVRLGGHHSHKPSKKMRSKPTLSVATEVPVYPDDMEPLEPEASSKQKMYQALFGDGDDSLDLLWVKPGSFVMGSPKGEPGHHPFENQHRVTLTQGFYLGKYEVTQGQYKAVMEGLSYIPQGEDKPMGLSWGEAIAFCRKLTEIESKAGRLPGGMSFQLPTEAEWEYSCRAGTTTTYWWGNDPDPKMANFGGDFMGPDTTRPVGQYPANPWGFHDMHGNNYEWCNDIGGANDRGDPDDVDGYGNPGAGPYHEGHVFNPQGNKRGGSRIQRGGCYWSGPTQIRSAYRHSHPARDKLGYKGFRVALKPNVPDPEKVIAKKIEKKEPNYPKSTMKLPTSGKHAVNLNGKVMMDMIWCPPGTFTMGSPSTETGHYRDEGQHQVSLTKGFFLGKYEVTQAQYLAVMTGNTDYKNVKPSRWPYNANRPVENVSWRTVQVFLKRLNHLQRLAGQLPEGWTYVLPTESQWEYACRAGTTSSYSWGDSIDKTKANYLWEGTYDFFKDDKQPCEVGRYAPNPWGFYDMHGNVREWTADWLGRYPGGNPVINPTGATSGHHRVTRGGSWRFVEIGLRSAARHGTIPKADDSEIGFRVALQHQTHPEHEEAAHEAPAGEVPTELAHEAPAGEVPVTTEKPIAPGDMPPLDAGAPKK